MPLLSLSYKEYENDPRYWCLENCDFTKINLIVGKNATGKSRLINVLSGLCRMLTSKQSAVFDSGTYTAKIEIDGQIYSLLMEFSEGKVVRENLSVDGKEYLSRDQNGKGLIYYAHLQDYLPFQAPPSTVAFQQRQDELQHPQIVKLAKWANGCRTYHFGSSLGRETFLRLGSYEKAIAADDNLFEGGDLVSIYARAYSTYGEAFDQAVIRDMKTLGYPLLDVGTDDIRPMAPEIPLTEPVIGMYVIEDGRALKLPQTQMSQGMFRALALVIHMNVAVFGGHRTLLLIDDIGEGLDYERSVGLIELLVTNAHSSKMQLIMTSNDRFVMNKVPLEHWMLLKRTGASVQAFTERNSPSKFEEFKFLGLSNFDLLSSDFIQ